MQTKLNPYLSFKDNAREAMNFYKDVFGGKLSMNTFKEFNLSQSPSEDNLLMHAMLEADNGIVLMGADTPSSMPFRENGNGSISLSGNNEAELRGYYQKLAKDGEVLQPLEKAPWGDAFGMVKDKYGVEWMVNISGQPG